MEDRASNTAEANAALKPPQFTLRTLLVAMTAVAALLGLLTAVGLPWSLALLFFLSLITAHVMGNAVGTRLRDRSPQRVAAPPAPAVRRALGSAELAAPAQLARRSAPHWFTLVMTCGGALAGGYFGGGALAASYPEATTAAAATGYASSGLLGAFAGFLGSSFLGVMRTAISEAHAASDPHRPKRRTRS